MTVNLPDIAISIMQPWAWLIVNGHKDIENRQWSTGQRGFVAIHAGKKADEACSFALTGHDRPLHPVTGAPFDIETGAGRNDADDVFNSFLPPVWSGQQGGIVGVAEIVDCVDRSESSWFVGRYGFVIRNARPVDFIPVRGGLGFFDWRKNIE